MNGNDGMLLFSGLAKALGLCSLVVSHGNEMMGLPKPWASA